MLCSPREWDLLPSVPVVELVQGHCTSQVDLAVLGELVAGIAVQNICISRSYCVVVPAVIIVWCRYPPPLLQDAGHYFALDADDGWTGAMRNEWCAAPARLALLPSAAQLTGTNIATDV